MKKILTLLLASSALLSFAQIQGPVIEGTYLPVRGTAVTEIWDNTSGKIPVPDTGINVSWNYYFPNNTDTGFVNPTQPYRIATFHPKDSIPSDTLIFPDATHASYLTAPLPLIDSLYSYYVVDNGGLYMIGGRSTKSAPSTGSYVTNDTTVIFTKRELYAPANIYYGRQIYDTSIAITYGRISVLDVKIKQTKYKDMQGVGYGSLTMPDGRFYTGVVLTKAVITTYNTAYFPANSTNVLGVDSSKIIEYSFLRNNTFATSVLMYLNADTGATFANLGWYTVPVDFGYITGTVYTDATESTPVINGKALLYRENSNFAKHDILDSIKLDSYGNYKLDSIPFGLYRIAIRPDLDDYPNAFTTYYGDTTDWIGATNINTINPNDSSSDGHKIHLQYHPAPQGQGQISGNLNLNGDIRTNDPIPGVDIIVEKNPGGGAFRETKTDIQGNYSLGNLDDGNYTLFVDIPGLPVKTTYDFEIIGGTVIGCLDFTSGTDTIRADYFAPPPACSSTSIKGSAVKQLNSMQAYPNPYTTSTTIKVDITEKSDVVLEVYNVLGKKVTTLEKGVKQAGVYSYNFNAKSLNQASGLYFVKLLVNNKIDVLRIVEQ